MADLSRAEAMRILGLIGELNEDTIKSAFKKRVLELHPDKYPGDSTEAKETQAAATKAFKQLIPARDFLLTHIKELPERACTPPPSGSASPVSTQGVSEAEETEDEVLDIIIDDQHFVIDLNHLDSRLPTDILKFIKGQLLIPHIRDEEVFDALEKYLTTRERTPCAVKKAPSRSHTNRFDAIKSIKQPDTTELKVIAEYVVEHKKTHFFLKSDFEKAAITFLKDITDPMATWKWRRQLYEKSGDKDYAGLTKLDKYRALIARDAELDPTRGPRL